MSEREYRIKDSLLQRIINAFKAVVVAYHWAAPLRFFGSKLRRAADQADAAAEALKKEMRKQDGQE